MGKGAQSSDVGNRTSITKTLKKKKNLTLSYTLLEESGSIKRETSGHPDPKPQQGQRCGMRKRRSEVLMPLPTWSMGTSKLFP